MENDIILGITHKYGLIADFMQQIDAHIHNSTEGARHDPPIIIFGRAKEFDYKITEHDEYPYPYRRNVWRIS